jgi:hypothetical protein
MPDSNVVVSPILALDPPLDPARPDLLRDAGRGFTVALEQDRRLRLDPADPRTPGYAQVLDSLRRLRAPVYAEIGPDGATVARLLIPVVDRVAELRRDDRAAPGAGGLLLRMERSHALRLLPADSPDFAAFEAMLREAMQSGAPVVVTVDNGRGIIDVRRPGPDWPIPPFPGAPPRPRPSILDGVWARFRRIWRLPLWPWWWFGCVSATRAQAVFDAMRATSCAPLTVPAPCIPFLYPDDGCFARAHEMCRLMSAMGVRPRKVWIRGSLRTPTRNHPSCAVLWGWHVAPTLCVRGFLFFWGRPMVVDPSLFDMPVTPAVWKSVQGDPAATLDHTDASPYFHVWGDVFDPGYVMTNQDLATYRTFLLARATNSGPPPYAHCP